MNSRDFNHAREFSAFEGLTDTADEKFHPRWWRNMDAYSHFFESVVPIKGKIMTVEVRPGRTVFLPVHGCWKIYSRDMSPCHGQWLIGEEAGDMSHKTMQGGRVDL